MKYIISFMLVQSFVLFQLNAQETDQKSRSTENQEVQTLFSNNGSFGGFLMTGVKAGVVNGKSALLVGGAVLAVFSSKLNIGFAGYGLVTETEADTYSPNGKLYKLDMGYGGLILEPVIGNRKLVHITVPVLLGVGGAGLRSNNNVRDSIEDDFDREFEYDESDLFLVAEPGINLELNLIKNIRLNLGASYRQVYDSNLEGISSEELSGFTGSVGLKFGWF